MGRIRPARLDEGSREDMLRADAVLALTENVPMDLSAFEQFVASLIDGVRPVARIKKKANVSSSDLRIALNGLADRNLVRLAGIVEEAVGALAADIAQMSSSSSSSPAPSSSSSAPKRAPPPPAVIILPLPPELAREMSAADIAGNAVMSAADIAGNAERPVTPNAVSAVSAVSPSAVPLPMVDDAVNNADFLNEPTISGRDSPIPAHVMAEIRAMIDEDEATAATLAFEDDEE